jgi:hypothetical protein
LQRAAKRRHAKAIDSDRWFRELLRDRLMRTQAESAEPIKPEGPFSPGEVEFWLRQFEPGGGDDEPKRA